MAISDTDRIDEARSTGISPGDRIGKYTVSELVGEGSFGEVYAAYDGSLDRMVAIKISRPLDQYDLIEEGRVLGRIRHRCVVSVHGYGHHEGRPYIVMDYCYGVTLKQWITQYREWQEVVRVMVDVGRGIAAAHAAGVIHGDIKPSNIIIGHDGCPTVVDFGSSQDTIDLSDSTRRLTGTPAYLAPEQMTDLPTDLSDQFSFCVTLYEALHGRRPTRMRDGTIYIPLERICVPQWVSNIAIRGMANDPSCRYESMDELVAELDSTPRRRSWKAAIAAIAAAAVTALSMLATDSSGGGSSPAEDIEQAISETWMATRGHCPDSEVGL